MVDIMLGEIFNPYIHVLVGNLYAECYWKFGRENAYKNYQKACSKMLDALIQKQQEDNALARYITAEQLEFAKLYYLMKDTDAESTILNKNEIVKSMPYSRVVKDVLENWLCFWVNCNDIAELV